MFLAILWHHHQPLYRHPETGQYLLPYVNYHLTKNYYPMARLAEEEGFPCIFNLTPCLLAQIEDYVSGRAIDPWQEALEKDADQLTSADIQRLERFLSPGEIETQKQRLQQRVLSLFLPPLPEPASAMAVNQEYLLSQQEEIKNKVIPIYKKLWFEKKVELTTSAYYHPLLPLIIDLSVAGEALMPSLPFRYPEDAQRQIQKGRSYFESLFGKRPQGFWPSEGGISSAVAQMVAEAGYTYAITDENILWKSLKRPPDLALIGRPYACHRLVIFFRDRELSDLLSFEYQRWPVEDALRHFQNKIGERRKIVGDEGIIVLALDGENPWAGYEKNGIPFLRRFYACLLETEGVNPVLLNDYVQNRPVSEEIEVVPGTWLGNFSRWIGHPAKNAAWEKLSRVRQESGVSEALLAAEGSDWFWWLGDAGVDELAELFAAFLAQAAKKPTRGLVS